jgi:hypothetical protein
MPTMAAGNFQLVTKKQKMTTSVFLEHSFGNFVTTMLQQ